MISKSYSQIIAYNKDGKFLLQHRTSDAPKDPNKWDLFGGEVEGIETPEEGMARELKEELDLEINVYKLYLKTEIIEEGVNKIRYYFEYEIEYDAEYLRQHQHEGQGLDFFSSEDLMNLDIRDHQMVVLKKFIKEKGLLL